MTITIDKERCKGCGYCIRECPQKALYFSEEKNLKGISFVQVVKEKCISCGICYTVCPDQVFEIK